MKKASENCCSRMRSASLQLRPEALALPCPQPAHRDVLVEVDVDRQDTAVVEAVQEDVDRPFVLFRRDRARRGRDATGLSSLKAAASMRCWR